VPRVWHPLAPPDRRRTAKLHIPRLSQWPDDEERRELRAYWLDDGDVMIAPWNPAIRPGMEVVAERIA